MTFSALPPLFSAGSVLPQMGSGATLDSHPTPGTVRATEKEDLGSLSPLAAKWALDHLWHFYGKITHLTPLSHSILESLLPQPYLHPNEYFTF